jgi:hypothetical protein
MRRYLILLPVLALLAGCGGTKTVTQTVTSTTTATPPPTKTVQPVPCPPGNSFAGCSVVGQPSTGRLRLSPVPGPEFPDVSNWQGPITPSGHSAGVDWSQVKAWQQGHGWAPGGAFKLGEFGVDPDASINNGKLKALGMWRTGYWFVRDTGCQHEAGQIIAEA